MKKQFIFAILLSTLVFLPSCEKDPVEAEPGKLRIVVSMSDGTQSVSQDENISFSNGQDLNISLFRLYLSNLTLMEGERELEIKNLVLVDPGSNSNNSFTMTVENGNYSTLSFGLGVNATQNNLNPADFDNNHPLSTYQSMYWSMLKYRFAKFEGKANLNGKLGSSDDVSVAFHPGTDPLYQQVSLPISLNISEDNTYTLNIEIDLNEMFAGSNPFDLTDETQTQTHSNSADIHIAQKFMENLKASISVK